MDRPLSEKEKEQLCLERKQIKNKARKFYETMNKHGRSFEVLDTIMNA
jgi:hypothetical protein